MTPFFDTRDTERIRLALNILRYPQHYCLKHENLQRLARLLPATDGVQHLVQTLKVAQTALAPHLPLPFDSIWSLHEALPENLVPTTTYNGSGLRAADIAAFARSLDRMLLEETLETMADTSKSTPATEVIGQAIACAWLSQHLALVALGLAKVESHSPDQLVITSASPDATMHFRRLWFAAAFEELSLRKAQASLEIYAELAGRSKEVKGDVRVAFADALSVIPQHWRLPVDEGPVASLMEDHLQPLIWLAGAVFHAAQSGKGRPVVQADLPSPKAFRRVFADVMEDQLKCPRLDRCFEVRKGGLVLGPRKLAPGLLMIAERLAAKQLGPTWHGKQLSNVQKKYLLKRLGRIPQVQVVDVEVAKHDTTDGTHVDVDLFIRDLRRGILFAVQLKHFEYSDKCGLRYWLDRFRPGKLAYGLAQIEAFGVLAKTDPKIRTKLLANGITAEELDQVVPIVLHNIGLLDCLTFQAGILVYDQHTFVNVLDGRSAVAVGVVDRQAVHLNFHGNSTSCRLDDPNSVVSAYASDPHFADIAHFDAAADVTRRLRVSGSSVVTHGLGI